MEQETVVVRPCARCGRPLPADAAEGLCASCLFEVGLETLTRESNDEAQTIGSPRAGTAMLDQQLSPGQTWGGYRIGRLLGRGGMGEVYEAEQISTGRRLALKVLRGQLQDAGERARFLREGQLAASVSHPHTVYIFGSEEIDGTPVITMELLPGGTLKDRVATEGPLASTDAVGAVLDIIGGLDAAHAAGILHRDIKPSNCFVDNERAVKVGDFGLSISTLARDVRHELDAGGFQGTPQFAPPEQLRGEPLDVRADIYAVGATLYYLLTGRAPFDARDLRELFTHVLNDAPAPPRSIRPDIPAGLAAIVLRCLAKTPAERPASYAELADALRPFSAVSETPAKPGLRIIANIVDNVIVSFAISIWRLTLLQGVSNTGTNGSDSKWQFVVPALYFLILEGFWSASLGKWVFGMRVAAGHGGNRWWRIAVRTLIFYLTSLVPALTMVLTGSDLFYRWGSRTSQFTLDVGSSLPFVFIAVLFSTARRRNGWAGLHELASGTRVVSRRASLVHRARRNVENTLPTLERHAPLPTFGPFKVLSDVGDTGEGHLYLGFDPILRRQVWIHARPANAVPVTAARRDVSRVGRLHWLSGPRVAGTAARREGPNEGANWDAFETPRGEALLARPIGTAEWRTVKLWLVDVARELAAAARDGSTPMLSLDRLWLRDDGHVVLLDFAAPPMQHGYADAPRPLTPIALLSAIAAHGLSNHTVTVPVSAQALLRRWASGHETDFERAQQQLIEIAEGPDLVTRGRRALPMALASMPVIVMTITAILVLPLLGRLLDPENGRMLDWLEAIDTPNTNSRLADPALREAAEIYAAARFSARLRDDGFWSSVASSDFTARRARAREIVARYPSVSRDEFARVSAALAPEISALDAKRGDGSGFAGASGLVVAALAALALVFVTACSVVSCLIVPGGIVTRLLGLAAVTRDGVEIGRLRSVTRVLIAWSSALVWCVVLLLSKKVQGFVPSPAHPLVGTAVTIGILAAGAAWTLVRPARGPHDWIMGTSVVPR